MSLNSLEKLAGIALAMDTTVHEHVTGIRLDVIENEADVRDYQSVFGPLAPKILLQQPVYGFAECLQVFKVNSRFGFVNQHEIGVLEEQLEDFRFLDFPTREADIEITVKKL
jgi:hypothetical protein